MGAITVQGKCCRCVRRSFYNVRFRFLGGQAYSFSGRGRCDGCTEQGKSDCSERSNSQRRLVYLQIMLPWGSRNLTMISPAVKKPKVAMKSNRTFNSIAWIHGTSKMSYTCSSVLTSHHALRTVHVSYAFGRQPTSPLQPGRMGDWVREIESRSPTVYWKLWGRSFLTLVTRMWDFESIQKKLLQPSLTSKLNHQYLQWPFLGPTTHTKLYSSDHGRPHRLIAGVKVIANCTGCGDYETNGSNTKVIKSTDWMPWHYDPNPLIYSAQTHT